MISLYATFRDAQVLRSYDHMIHISSSCQRFQFHFDKSALQSNNFLFPDVSRQIALNQQLFLNQSSN